MQSLASTIHAVLFATAEPYSIKNLTVLLEKTEEEVSAALHELTQNLEESGIMLVHNNDTVTLATRPEHSSVIEKIRKEELSRELSKASAETLAVICYHPGATKAEIELIRGVNVSYSLRALAMRGLIETVGAGRSITYSPTLDLLEHFGVSSIEELPLYEETTKKITALLTQEQPTA